MDAPPVRPLADHSARLGRLLGDLALPTAVGAVVFVVLAFFFAPVAAVAIGLKVLELAFYAGLAAIGLSALGLLSPRHRRRAAGGLVLGGSAVLLCMGVVFAMLLLLIVALSHAGG